MRVVVDELRCDAHGVCVNACPEVFALGDDSLDALRNVLFTRAGAGPGATFADALRALGTRDPQLARVMAVAERARFGPAAERAAARADLLELGEAYMRASERAG